MLEQREQRHRRQPAERRFGDEPREHAGLGVGQRIAAGIVGRRCSSARARRTRRASARSGVTSAAVLPSCTASRSATAIASASSSAFAASITATSASAASRAAVVGALAPSARSLRRPHRLGDEPRRARALGAEHGRRRRASMPMRRSSACMANCGWPDAGGSRRVAADQRPRTSRRDRCRGRAAPRRRAAAARWSRAASRSPASSRSSRRRSPARHGVASRARFGLDQQVAPRRRLDPRRARAGSRANASRAICRNSSVLLPVLVEFARHECRRAGPSHLPRRHVVHQPREIVGERERRGRAVGDQRLPASGAQAGRARSISGRAAASSMRRSSPPSASGIRAHRPPLAACRRRRARPRRCRRAARCAAGSAASVLSTVEERVAREPAGAPRRQVQRRVGERERIVPAGTRDQPSVAQRADQRRQKRRGCGNGEDARRPLYGVGGALDHDLMRSWSGIPCEHHLFR